MAWAIWDFTAVSKGQWRPHKKPFWKNPCCYFYFQVLLAGYSNWLCFSVILLTSQEIAFFPSSWIIARKEFRAVQTTIFGEKPQRASIFFPSLLCGSRPLLSIAIPIAGKIESSTQLVQEVLKDGSVFTGSRQHSLSCNLWRYLFAGKKPLQTSWKFIKKTLGSGAHRSHFLVPIYLNLGYSL